MKYNFKNSTLASKLQNNSQQSWNTVKTSDNRNLSLISAHGQTTSATECATVLNELFVKSFSVLINIRGLTDLFEINCESYTNAVCAGELYD